MKHAITSALPLFRPYLAQIAFVLLATIAASASEGAQAYLLKPLLDQILLKSADQEADSADELTRTRAVGSVQGFPAALAAEEKLELPAAPSGPLQLRIYGGRAAPEGYAADPVCQLLARSRRVLLIIERSFLDEDDDEDPLLGWAFLLARAGDPARPVRELREAARLQLKAEALLGTDPRDASAQARALAVTYSLRSREAARAANFASAWSILGVILIVAVACAAILGVSRYTQTVLARTMTVKIARDLQVKLVGHVLSLDASQLGDQRRGDLLSRLSNDLQRTIGGIIAPLSVTLLQQPFRLLVYLAVAAVISLPLCLILIALGLTVMIPIRRLGRHVKAGAAERQVSSAEVLEALHQMFAGIRLVKGFQRERFEQERFEGLTLQSFKAAMKVNFAWVSSRTLVRMTNEVTVPLVVCGGGALVVKGWLGLGSGTLVAFSALILLMYRPVKALAQAYNHLQNAQPSLERLQEILAKAPSVVDDPDAQPLERLADAVEVKDLRYSYDGENEVLKGISFRAPVGTTTAVVGHTGSGKSTLLDLLARYMDPSQGEVLMDGVPLTKIQLRSYLDRVAVVSQDCFLFNDSVRENIRYGRLEATDAEVEEAARAAHIHEEIVAREGGYDSVAGERGGKLSGGQVQRLTLARAFIRKPQVLLLDEGTSALDARTERLVQNAIADLEKTCTTFVIAHRLSTVRHADQILVLDGGELVERGSHDELLAQGGRYADLVAQLEDSPDADS